MTIGKSGEPRAPTPQERKLWRLANILLSVNNEWIPAIRDAVSEEKSKPLVEQARIDMEEVAKYVYDPKPDQAESLTKKSALLRDYLRVLKSLEGAALLPYIFSTGGEFTIPPICSKFFELLQHHDEITAMLERLKDDKKILMGKLITGDRMNQQPVEGITWETIFFIEQHHQFWRIFITEEVKFDDLYMEATDDSAVAYIKVSILSIVAYDAIRQATANHETAEGENWHRAVNALQELEDTWQKWFPPLADFYRRVRENIPALVTALRE